MTETTTAYIGLGSNLGERKSFIEKAVKALAETGQIEICRISDIIETSPLGGLKQPAYLNAAAEIATTLSVEDLHKRLIEIENSLGRVRGEKWSPRTIDLDILLFGRQVIKQPDLTVPHPQMHLRSFVLKELCQLNGKLVHPVMKVTMNELARRLNGADFVLNPQQPQVVSIAGNIGVGKTTVAKKLSEALGCKLMLEPYDTNPYLPQVYAGKKELALDSQLYFLTSRVKQLNRDVLEKGRIVVSDYVFDKEGIYAKRLLNGEQLAAYERIYPPMEGKIVMPTLVIYLKDTAERCLERIHRRNHPYEQKIELEFLEGLDGDYEQLFAGWKKSPVIRILMTEFDCNRDGDVDNLVNQIKHYTAMI
jgi:2-amino-4-hydroxy-6-hydroxymethyldihydropteridine diphosphokinase